MESRTIFLFGSLLTVLALWLWSRTKTGAQAVGNFTDLGAQLVTTLSGSVGLRNNNPGNMKWNAKIAWEGQVGQDTKGFIIFDTLEHGIRAMVKELRNYSALHNLNTVAGIISRWSATDQDAYISNVSNELGVDPYENIDVTDEGTMITLVHAIVSQENGPALTMAIPESDLLNGVQAGLA